VPACEVCGRQDETLRLVILPYVISLLVVTFQRAWSGLFCARHRNERRILAGIITGVAGWIGIPWGFIYTPKALFDLAKGGIQPEDANIHLLQDLAKDSLETGDPHAAIRILEEALKLKDEATIRQQLQELYDRFPLSITKPPPLSPFPFITGLGASILIGLTIGILDYLITALIGLVLGGDVNIFLAILSWAPFVTLIFLGGLFLAAVLRWVIEQTRLEELMPASIFAVVAALLTFYGIPQGALFTDYLAAVLNGLQFDSFFDFILTSGEAFTKGGAWYLIDSLQSGLITDWIFVAIMVAALVFYVWLSLTSVRETVHWLVRIDLLKGDVALEEERSTLMVWASIGAVVVGVLLMAAIFSFGGGQAFGGNPEAVAYLEQGDAFFSEGNLGRAADEYSSAIQAAPHLPEPHSSLGWVLYSMGDLEGAMSEFEAARRIDSTWADPHLGLGFTYLALDDRETAQSEFEALLALTPDPYFQAQANYGLGTLQSIEGNIPEAIAYLEQAILQDWSLIIAHLDLAISYFNITEFERAVEKANDAVALDPNWSAPHAVLAMAYHQLGEPDLEVRELEWAEDMAPEDFYSLQLLSSAYGYRLEFSRVQELLLKAVELYPQNDQVALGLSHVYAAQHETDKALDSLAPVFARDPDSYYGHLAMGYIFTQLKDLDQALAEITLARDLNPDRWEAYRDLSFVYFHQGSMQEALAAAETAEEMYPYDSAIHAYKAFALRSLGDTEAAMESAKTAVERSPTYDLAHFVLGVCYLDQGDHMQGSDALRTFLSLAWDRAYVREYIDQAEAFLAQSQ
jgi:tetratricopeptide (TPR) repeat protein